MKKRGGNFPPLFAVDRAPQEVPLGYNSLVSDQLALGNQVANDRLEPKLTTSDSRQFCIMDQYSC
jgi:hypothetical protein